MIDGSCELARVPNERFEAFIEERPAPFAVTFETLMIDGMSLVTSARNEGGPEPPADGPANTWFVDTITEPVPPEETPRGVPRVSTSIEAPWATVNAYPGLDVV